MPPGINHIHFVVDDDEKEALEEGKGGLNWRQAALKHIAGWDEEDL